MKTLILTVIFMVLNLVSVYSRGTPEMNLVNVQEFGSGQIDSITVEYKSGDVSIFQADTNSIIVREYMNKDNSGFFAKITN
jgi:hypothetical protein